MARPRRAVRAQRERRARTRRYNALRNLITGALSRTLCGQHYNELLEGFYGENLHWVCTMVSEADVSVEQELGSFFPLDPERITQEGWREFKIWLASEMGEPISDECFQWYRFVKYSFLICATCRGNVPILVDFNSDSD